MCVCVCDVWGAALQELADKLMQVAPAKTMVETSHAILDAEMRDTLAKQAKAMHDSTVLSWRCSSRLRAPACC